MAEDTAEVVLKGEIHTSESDLEDERELVVEGIDTLVLEGDREDADYGVLRGWYGTAMSIVGLVFFDTLYTDHRILSDLATAQNAEVVPTRETDAELLENSHPLVEIVAAVLFYGIFVFSLIWGLATGRTVYGAVFLLGAACLPVYLLRRHEMSRRDPEKNRDEQVADRIVEATRDGGRVVAIVGEDHVDPIAEKLPNYVDLNTVGPVYSMYSWQHAKEIAVPAFTAWSVLFVGYLVLLHMFRIAVALTL